MKVNGALMRDCPQVAVGQDATPPLEFVQTTRYTGYTPKWSFKSWERSGDRMRIRWHPGFPLSTKPYIVGLSEYSLPQNQDVP